MRVKVISGEVNRDLALQLASQVVRIYGMEAMLHIGESSEQLLPLLVHLSSIEVRMILEDPNVEQVQYSMFLISNARALGKGLSIKDIHKEQ